MRYPGKLSVLLIMLLLSVTSCKSYQWSGSFSSSCTRGFTGPTQCTITFTPSKNFDWTASSTLDGVTVQPSSGSEAAGVSSGNIHVTIPDSACPISSGSFVGYLDFTDDTHHIQFQLNIVHATSRHSSSCIFSS
jgi:hypothetical protein